MTQELIRIGKTADIRSGIPEDIEILNKPFGYYEFIGVSRSATSEEIKRAYRRLSFKFHPDIGGDSKLMMALNAVYRVLSSSAEEYSKDFDLNLFGDSLRVLKQLYGQLDLNIREGISPRTRYDTLSIFDEYFSAYLSGEDNSRTRKFMEQIMQEINHLEAIVAQIWEEQNPVIDLIREENALQKELQDEKTDQKRKRAVEQRISELDEKYKRLSSERQRQAGTEESRNYEAEASRRNQIEQMLRRNLDEFRRLYNPHNDILDIYQQNPGNHVFLERGLNGDQLVPIKVDKKGNIVYVDSLGDVSISGSHFGSRVIHYKSISSHVDVEDPNISGIIQLLNGNVRIRYHNMGPKIIRIMAPYVKTSPDNRFVKKGDLYIPTEYVDRIKEPKPSLDISVKDGQVSLFAK